MRSPYLHCDHGDEEADGGEGEDDDDDHENDGERELRRPTCPLHATVNYVHTAAATAGSIQYAKCR